MANKRDTLRILFDAPGRTGYRNEILEDLFEGPSPTKHHQRYLVNSTPVDAFLTF
jgi:hypothetical protein